MVIGVSVSNVILEEGDDSDCSVPGTEDTISSKVQFPLGHGKARERP